MLAKTHDLPLRGNYFAEAEYLEQNLAAGTLRNRAGARMLALTDESLIAVHNAIADEFGPGADKVLKTLGRNWGSRAAGQFVAEMADHHERSAADLPLAIFAADLTAAFLHHGWGRFHFDFSRFSRGILGVDVQNPFMGSAVKEPGHKVEPLLSGFLVGMFSHLAGTELDCIQTECRADGSAATRFLLTVPERVAAITAMAAERTHDELLAELEKTTAGP